MEKIFNKLENLESQIKSILNLKDSLKERELVDKFSNLFVLYFDILKVYDKNKLEDLKNNHIHTFLSYVAVLEEISLPMGEYFNSIEEALNHKYTDNIIQEIRSFNLKIKELKNKLDSKNDIELLKNKEQLEIEFNRLTVIVKEKDELLQKNIDLKNFDFQKNQEEINELKKELDILEEKIEPLKAKKRELEINIKKNKELIALLKELETLEGKSSDFILKKIDKILQSIKIKQDDWNNNKEKYIHFLENKLKILKTVEEEIEKLLSELSITKEIYIKKQEILNKYFSSNKKILDSIPNLKNSIKNKLDKIEKELFEIDSEIETFLNIAQKSADELAKNPIIIE